MSTQTETPNAPNPSAKYNNPNLKEQIENSFVYHAPKNRQPVKYAALRETARELAHLINDLCPDSREKSKAITDLESCVMFANAAIARHE